MTPEVLDSQPVMKKKSFCVDMATSMSVNHFSFTFLSKKPLLCLLIYNMGNLQAYKCEQNIFLMQGCKSVSMKETEIT